MASTANHRCEGSSGGLRAIFHRWFDVSEIVSPSIVIGGHNNGVVRGTFTKYHRCEGSLSAGCKILKDYTRYNFTTEGWLLFYMDYDSYLLMNVAKIVYCPFCGRKLKEE